MSETIQRRDLSQYLQSEEALKPSISEKALEAQPLLDESELDTSEELLNREAFAGSIFSRPIFLVSAGIITLFIGAGWTFLVPSDSPQLSQPSAEKEKKLFDNEKSKPQSAQKVDDLLAENALTTQQQELKDLAQQKHSSAQLTVSHPPPKREIPSSAAVSETSYRPVPVRTVQVPSSNTVPVPHTPYRRVARRVQPVYQPVSSSIPRRTPIAVSNPPEIVPSPSPAPLTPQEAHEQWLAVAQLGKASFSAEGGHPQALSFQDRERVTSSQERETASNQEQVANSSPGEDSNQLRGTDDVFDLKEESSLNPETPVLNEKPWQIYSIPRGTVVRGVIDRAIAWSEESDNRTPVLIRLVEPVIDEQKQIVLEKETLVLAQLQATNSDLVLLNPLEIVSAKPPNISITSETITISKPKGNPLVAKRKDTGSDSKRGVNWTGLFFDVFRTGAEMTLGNSDNAYQGMYQLQRLEEAYERNFGSDEREFNNSFNSGGSYWMLPANTAVELYFNQDLTIRKNNNDE